MKKEEVEVIKVKLEPELIERHLKKGKHRVRVRIPQALDSSLSELRIEIGLDHADERGFCPMWIQATVRELKPRSESHAAGIIED